MKRILSLVLIASMLLVTLGGCSMFSSDKDSIGKTANSFISVYQALSENFALRKKEGYSLYGAKLSIDKENVGKYTFVYTNKRPDDIQYSDILVVVVNLLNGKIEKFSAPDFETYSSEPYELIKTSMPLDISYFKVDSDAAIKTANKCHFGNNFVYNFVEIEVSYRSGMYLYDISHISLVNDCIYKTTVDATTGTVITKAVEELV